MIAGRQQQRRDKAVETVEAQEQPHLGTAAKAQDTHGDCEKFGF